MDPDVDVKCLENPTTIFRVGDGGMFRHGQKKLEAIDDRKNPTDFGPIVFRDRGNCSSSHPPLAEILYAGFVLFASSRSSVVFGKYFPVCTDFITPLLLSEEK